ncbi:MAG: hypothetical protein PHW49_05190 [Acinetobacter harbinensis]|nr:hypothetical protein [Acinetobacter harbinensis]
MKRIIYVIILILLVMLSLISFGLGIYSKDIFFIAIGALLFATTVLIFGEIRKIDNDPFDH